MDIKELYENRVKDIIKTCKNQEPERVPVLANVLTWAIGYAGGNMNELLDSPEKMPGVWSKFLDDIYCDAIYSLAFTTPIRAIERLGSDSFFVSSDGHTVQHQERCVMQEDEYPRLIKEPLEFTINVLGERKFTELQKSDHDAYEALKDAALDIDRIGMSNSECASVARERYGVVHISSGHRVIAPVDCIFDRLRGLKGTILDMRRQKGNVLKAAESLFPLYQKLAVRVKGEFPFGTCRVHSGTFLGTDQFREIFWPTMRDLLIEAHNRGGKTMLYMEGTWKQHFQTLLELPESSVICMIDDDDIIEAKKILGHKFTIAGGIKTSLLKYGSKKECIEEAKRIVDLCAPGGGFIFSTDKPLCTLGDVNVDNYAAVNEFVHEYGAY